MTGKAICFGMLIVFMSGCASFKTDNNHQTQLKFLDEYIFPAGIDMDGEEIGGLSGIDNYNDEYIIVCDDAKSPRFYKTAIVVEDQKIDTVIFKDMTHINKEDSFVETHFLDLESILYDPQKDLILLSSEGSINKQKDPAIFEVDHEGNSMSSYNIPTYFEAKSPFGPRHNGLFEGLAMGHDKKGFWVATELPLETDGKEPTIEPAYSPVRITYYAWNNPKPQKQFIYQLDKIDKAPKEGFAVNGVTDMLAIDKNRFLVLERSYSSGWGNRSNGLRIYEINTSKSQNTLNQNELEKTKLQPIAKKRVLDMDSLRNLLVDKNIDNVEGICYGPILPNGNKTIILISDNNFNAMGPQLNQFFLFEVLNDISITN